jgi:hypothetical protein
MTKDKSKLVDFKDLKIKPSKKPLINVPALKRFLSSGGFDELSKNIGKSKQSLKLSDPKFTSKFMKMMDIKPTRGGVGGGNIFSQFGVGKKGKAMKKNPFDLNKGGMAKKKKMAKGGIAKKK